MDMAPLAHIRPEGKAHDTQLFKNCILLGPGSLRLAYPEWWCYRTPKSLASGAQ